MTKPQIKKELQGWYNTACWYGYADTPLGKMTSMEISYKATELGVNLEYPTAL